MKTENFHNIVTKLIILGKPYIIVLKNNRVSKMIDVFSLLNKYETS